VDIHNNATQTGAATGPMTQAAPPPAAIDGRATADAAALAKDATPDVPLPVPASPSQTGLISKASIATKDEASKPSVVGLSSAERMLKPYGINMLPEKQDRTERIITPETE